MRKHLLAWLLLEDANLSVERVALHRDLAEPLIVRTKSSVEAR